MTQIKERIEGHYEVEEVPYGRVYRWAPGHALIECGDCGRLIVVDPTATTCPCGADYTAVVEDLAGKPLEEDKAYCLEHQEHQQWLREKANPEHYEWLEFETLF